MKLPKSILIIMFFLSISLNAQETFKTMFYNLLNYPLQEPASRLQHLDYILGEYQPDLFMVCELNNADGATNILNVLQQSVNPNFAMANFVLNTSDNNIGDQNDLQNLIYYNSAKFILESQDEITTLYRDFNRYTLKLNTTNQAANPVYLEVFVCHLKASSGSENEDLRKQMVDDFVAYLDNPSNNFDSNSFVLLAGDLNVYSSDEEAFQELLNATNSVTFVDPANQIGSWHNNTNYINVFTQSTRTSSSLGGSTGGFDDRFDFIMTSDNMQSANELKYIANSYQVYGNNGNTSCYNQEINSNNCSGTEFDFNIRDALYNFSDHLPVTLQLQTDQSLGNNEFTIIDAITFNHGNVLTNKLDLNVNNNLIQAEYIDIYNTLGLKIKRIAIGNSNNITIDISHLANGVYFILVDNGSLKPLKFIKSN